MLSCSDNEPLATLWMGSEPDRAASFSEMRAVPAVARRQAQGTVPLRAPLLARPPDELTSR
jgi:hypothetical protein